MPEALRRVLLRFFREMVEYEPIARAGVDIEGVHKMRVGIRRMRSIYKTFGEYLPPRYHKRYPKLLRRTARTLGSVRDLDVFMERTQKYVASYLNGDPESLTALIKLNHTEHQVARTQLIHWLDSSKYHDFVNGYFDLLQEPLTAKHLQRAEGGRFAFQVNHILPQMIYERFNALRRYESLLENTSPTTLHEMRIEAKRFRYTLDAFAEILGDSVKGVIGGLKTLQDQLGDLNDAAVGIERLGVAYDCVAIDQRGGIVVYQDHFKETLSQKMTGTPAAWEAFNTPELRQSLAQAVGNL